MFKFSPHSGDMYPFDSRWTGQNLDNAGTISQTIFFPKNIDQIFVDKSWNFRLQTESNQLFLIHHLASNGMPYMGY